MKYLLDTCTISFLIRGHERVSKKLKSLNHSDVFISIISQLEIEYGFILNPEMHQKKRKWLAFQEVCGVVNFTHQEVQRAAEVLAFLQKNGTKIGPYDSLIAATALAHNLVCVTNNVREFSRVPGLEVEDWA